MFVKIFQALSLAAVVLGLPAEQLTVTNTLRNPKLTVTFATIPIAQTLDLGDFVIKKPEPTSTTTEPPPPSLTTSPSGPPLATGSWPTFPYSSPQSSVTSQST
ncbi:hypothetical protein F5Y05DRAFT_26093 [Hypoxylon sp. FL0543]|nr:hypothetical protein F5Y05DRAFT_26093 [Hypoxylon sp. FL0543]